MTNKQKEILGLILILTSVITGVSIAHLSTAEAGVCQSLIQLVTGLMILF